ncbi:MAG: pseudouridine synthase family protein [Bdellovibrionales bacterium]
MKRINENTGICHLRVAEGHAASGTSGDPGPIKLSEFVRRADLHPLSIEPCAFQVDEWMHWGCVYVDGQRTREDRWITPGQIVRLHTRPKRYHWTHGPLRDRVVFANEEILVLDKPAGLPTHPTLDNYLENAKVQLEKELEQPVFVTHRLDVATQGLLILAKTRAAQTLINKAFARNHVEKVYHAITSRPVPEGLYVHYINPQGRVPREISSSFHPGWWECRLEVEESGKAGLAERYWQRIRLLTGKTHQIRAQFAALNAPVVGDALYGGRGADEAPGDSTFVPLFLHLECFRLTFLFRSETLRVRRPQSFIDQI